MPYDLDQLREQEDREFKIRGETFRIRRIRPELMDELEKMQDEYVAIEEPTYAQLIAFAEDRLKLLIDSNGQVEKWEALRAREEDPIEYGEIVAISRRAFELVSGVPTLQPAPSTPGGGKTDKSSGDGSS